MKRFSLITEVGVEQAQKVVDVTLGREKADLVIINGTLLNVYTGEFLDRCAVATKGAWIAYVGGNPEDNIDDDTEVIDAEGMVIVPGLIDGHTHLADFQYNPVDFLRYAMRGGTTTIVTETIEPYPILGYEGVMEFLSALRGQPVKIFATAPAMASTSRKVHGIQKKTLGKLISSEDMLGLGESFWQSVLLDPDKFLPNFEEVLKQGKYLEGHSAGAGGRKLMAYLAYGISSCHEPINAKEALERLRLGIYVMVREGGIRRDLAAIAQIKDSGIDLRRLILVSDGQAPRDLLEIGYMEDVVQRAIACGFDPVAAIQMVTINVAAYFGLDGIIGGIAPGKYADMAVIPDLNSMKAAYVISNGKILAKDGRVLISPREHAFSVKALNTIHLPRMVRPADFIIPVKTKASRVKVRVIEQVTDLVTRERILSVPLVNDEIRADRGKDLLKVAAIDRRFSPGKTFVGLIRGFRLDRGALASSGAWDTSNIIVVGENEKDMALAVNRIRALRGGVVLCAEGKSLVELPLPILGLMTNLRLPQLVERISRIDRLMKEFGFPFRDPIRTLVTLTGAAIPFLRICEEGLFDIKTGKILNLIVDES